MKQQHQEAMAQDIQENGCRFIGKGYKRCGEPVLMEFDDTYCLKHALVVEKRRAQMYPSHYRIAPCLPEAQRGVRDG